MFPVPVLIGGAALLAFGAYEYDKNRKTSKPEVLRGIAPAGATETPDGPGRAATGDTVIIAPPSPAGGGGGVPSPPRGLGLSGLRKLKGVAPPGVPTPSRSPAANAVAHLTQPQPPGQPPLPPAPAPAMLPKGATATVSTHDTGQAGALRVRSGPSTTAPSIAGGEPGSGGGFPHLSIVQIVGDMDAGFLPTKGRNAAGQELIGYAWAGYLTPTGGSIAGESAEYVPRKQSNGNIRG
jgi:hypothetical protein